MWEISLLNLYMLLATIPEYSIDDDKDDSPKDDEAKALEQVFKGMKF